MCECVSWDFFCVYGYIYSYLSMLVSIFYVGKIHVLLIFGFHLSINLFYFIEVEWSRLKKIRGRVLYVMIALNQR